MKKRPSRKRQEPFLHPHSSGSGLSAGTPSSRGFLAAGTFLAVLVTLPLLGQSSPTEPTPPRSVIGAQELVEVERPPSGELENAGNAILPAISVNLGSRVYRSTNIARVETADSAMVVENNLGINASWAETMIAGYRVKPSLILLGQRAYHGRFHLSGKDKKKDDLQAMDYEFRMAMLAMEIGLTESWTTNVSYEFDKLMDFYEGEALYNAKAPTLSIRKMWQMTKKTIITAEPRLRYASTQTLKQHPVAGAFFDDDGDNMQLSSTLTLIRSFGPEDRGLLMPSMGFMRTQYLRDDATGRIDYLLTAALNASYQWKPWLGSQIFANFGHKFANSKGERLTGAGSKYDVWDFGLALSGNWSF